MSKKLAVIAGVILLAAAACTKPGPTPPFNNQIPSPGDVPVALTVDLSKQGIQIPADFTGLSFEKQSLLHNPSYWNSPTFINLVKGLGHGTLRIGGASVDQVHFISNLPLDSSTLFIADINNFFAFAGATGWPVTYGLSLKPSDSDRVVSEASFVFGNYYQQLLNYELGHEPDLYNLNGQRPSYYNYESFKYDWTYRKLKVSLGAPPAKFAGPGTSSNTWVVAFARDRGQFLQTLTEDYYKLGTGSDTTASISRLLDGNTEALSRVAVMKATSDAYYHMPYRLNECNSVAGAQAGVANSFASSLWALDFLFALAEKGVAGVNMHGGNAPSTPISFLGPLVHPNPLYYGMLLFSKASSGKTLTVQPLGQVSLNLTSHAVQQADGTVQVTLINKDMSKEAYVALSAINGSMAYHSATAMRLKGPSPSATYGTLLAGDSTRTDGTWTPKTIENLVIAANALTVKVPACSAVLVTLGNGSAINNN